MLTVRIYKSKGLVSNLIKWQTNSEYSHASIVVTDNNGISRLYEAREFKGVLSRLAIDQEDYDEFMVKDITRNQELGIIEFLERQIGKKYDYWLILQFVARNQNTRKASGKWICSELVYAALRKVGIELLARTEPVYVSPGLLARSPLLLDV